MSPNAEKPYVVLRTPSLGGRLYAIAHVPSKQILMYSRTGPHARQIARWFNEWDTMPVEPSSYDGSQWEVDPIQ